MIKNIDKTLVTYSDIEDIIDDCILNDKPFTFVCDEDLAEYVVCFIEEEFGIEVEDSELYEADEYYVTFIPGENGEPAILFCEDARCRNGEYKTDDGYSNYYVFTDMSEIEARNKLLAGNYGFYEVVDDEEDIFEENNKCDGNCEYCNLNYEDDDETEVINEILDNFADEIINGGCMCEDCLKETLRDLFDFGRRTGYQDAKDEIQCFVEEMVN